ncbi:hypothetical protein BC628DRAFT_135104 [Trametes gibbosa]|nr:hypothetical protein BC628DRAFT_135104 [Trametes gibbosa]
MKLACVDLGRLSDIANLIPQLEPLPKEATCDNCRRLPRAHLLALLQCQDSDGSLLALPLCRPPPGLDKGLHIRFEVFCPHPRPWVRLQHAVNLSEETLGQLVKHRSFSTVDVFILHHHSRPSLSKLPLEVILGDPHYVACLMLEWGLVDFELDSDSVEELDLLGFTLLPLKHTESSGAQLLSFTLASYSVFRPWTAKIPRQKVAIDISLRSVDHECAETVITAANFTFGPHPHCGFAIPPDTEMCSADSIFDIPPSCILDTRSCAYLALGRSSSNRRMGSPTSFVLAQAEFPLYVGPPEEDTKTTVHIRWLKLSVHHSIDRPVGGLCISVALSDVGTHANPGGNRLTTQPSPDSYESGEYTDVNDAPSPYYKTMLHSLQDAIHYLRWWPQ